jgi:hypothetical protein
MAVATLTGNLACHVNCSTGNYQLLHTQLSYMTADCFKFTIALYSVTEHKLFQVFMSGTVQFTILFILTPCIVHEVTSVSTFTKFISAIYRYQLTTCTVPKQRRTTTGEAASLRLNTKGLAAHLPNSMEQSPSSEASSCSASQEIPSVLCNPKVYCIIHKRSSPVPILSQMNPIHASLFHFLEIHCNITFLSRLRSSKRSLSLKSPHQNPVCNSSDCYISHIQKLLLQTLSWISIFYIGLLIKRQCWGGPATGHVDRPLVC